MPKINNSENGEPHHSKGQASRATILLAAAKLATIKGVVGLSLGDLAAEVGMSKSGLYAHFKSKEELELATIATATAIFDTEVLQPALKAPPGATRLRTLTDAFLAHLERKVFPGGCFFSAVASELDTQPGPARDKVFEVLSGWMEFIRQCVLDAQSKGEIDPKAQVDQIVFEIEAMLMAGNARFVMQNDTICLTKAKMGVENVIARVAIAAESKKKATARRKS